MTKSDEDYRILQKRKDLKYNYNRIKRWGKQEIIAIEVGRNQVIK